MIDIDSRSIKEGILAIMGIYGFFFFGRALFWNNYRAKVAARLAGTSRVQSAVLSLKIKLRGPHGPLVIIVLGLIIINPFLINYEDSIQWKTLVLMGEAFLMFAFSGYLVPPSILLLGTSSLDTAKLFVEIDRRIFPYRTVFLLDQVKSELFKVQKDAVPHFSINNLRVRSSYDWRRTVDLISNNIPLIILDCRRPSSAISDEIANIISSPHLADKAIFICNEDGSVPALAGSTAIEPGIHIETLSVSAAIAAIPTKGFTEIMDIDKHPVFGPKDFRKTDKRIDFAMKLVAKSSQAVGPPLEEYLQFYGRDYFVVELDVVLYALSARHSSGVIGILNNLDRDIALLEAFIEKWKLDANPRQQVIVDSLGGVLHSLHRLSIEASRAPQSYYDGKRIETIK